MRSPTSLALDASFFLLGWSYVFVAPYTKVEESFNIQAIHDLLTHGFTPDKLKNFDHFIFSGPIPRTFLGSTLLTCIVHPFISIAAYLNLISSKADLQIIVRLALATVNALGLTCFRKAVSKRFGHTTASFFVLLTCSQFHLPFWMGRTLPNMFALPLVNVALSCLLYSVPGLTKIPKNSWKHALWLLAFSCIVFRVELLLLWIPITLQLFIQGQASLFSLLVTNLAAAVTASVASFFVDSYFWQRKLLPELSSFIFNVMYGKSSNWGVSPWQDYFTVHLPRLLMTGFPLGCIGLLSDPKILSPLFPHIVFILLISNLGHKEWRFIIYSIPAFNIVAARGLKYLTSRDRKTRFGQISFLVAAGALVANVAMTGILLRISMANYPGGDAIFAFHELIPSTVSAPHVHICNLAAQSGVTLFQHLHAPPQPSLLLGSHSVTPSLPWTYNRTENLSLADISSALHFTHIISEVPPSDPDVIRSWRLLREIPAFHRIVFNKNILLERPHKLQRKAFNVFYIEQKNQLWIYERN